MKGGKYLIFEKPSRGQYLVSGLIAGPHTVADRVGFCVQIRQEAGAYGSDLFFLRLCDGRLITHENQAFWAVGEEDSKTLDACFASTPGQEDYAHGYSIGGRHLRKGYLVAPSRKPRRQTAAPASSAVLITVKSADGETQSSEVIL